MDKVITFFIEQADKKEIQEFAKKQGLDTASFCRSLVLKYIKKSQEAVSQ